jgi:D-glycero-alpha-D-manno-heptose-7-phosphate kinase
MILVRAPLRVSFVGGGTDLPEWFGTFGGSVISTAIDKYVYALIGRLHPVWKTKYKFTYSKIECVNQIDEIVHPTIRECIRNYATDNDSLSIIYASDLPGNSGLGSSSAFCCAILNGINVLNERVALEKKVLADRSIYVERVLLAEAGGWQDQIASAYGGFNRIHFSGTSFNVEPLDAGFIEGYLKECVLIEAGSLRKASEISEDIKDNMHLKHSYYELMTELVNQAHAAILAKDYDAFSSAIDQSWNLKRNFSNSVESENVADLIKKIRSDGGVGIKLLGAGCGGYILARFKSPPQNLDSSYSFITFQSNQVGVEILDKS